MIEYGSLTNLLKNIIPLFKPQSFDPSIEIYLEFSFNNLKQPHKLVVENCGDGISYNTKLNIEVENVPSVSQASSSKTIKNRKLLKKTTEEVKNIGIIYPKQKVKYDIWIDPLDNGGIINSGFYPKLLINLSYTKTSSKWIYKYKRVFLLNTNPLNID